MHVICLLLVIKDKEGNGTLVLSRAVHVTLIFSYLRHRKSLFMRGTFALSIIGNPKKTYCVC